MEENPKEEFIPESKKGSIIRKATFANKRMVLVEDFMRSQVFYLFFLILSILY